MTESEFLELSDAMFGRIQQVIDLQAPDIECMCNGAVLELEFDDGSKIIVNRHAPTRELWIAARSGGFHFAQSDGEWRNTRDGQPFLTQLASLVAAQGGGVLAF